MTNPYADQEMSCVDLRYEVRVNLRSILASKLRRRCFQRRSPNSPGSRTRMRNLEVERRAVTRAALRPNSASHSLDPFPHNRQADAGAGISIRFRKPFEDLEQSVLVLRVKARSIITHP